MDVALLTRDEINEIIRQVAKETAERVSVKVAPKDAAPATQHKNDLVPEVMTMDQVCAYLQITKLKLTEQISKGLPVTYKLGEARYFKSEMNAWLKGTGSKLKASNSMQDSLKIKGSDVPSEYGMSRSTLWRLRKEELITPVGRIGKKEYIYLRADIEKQMKSML